MRDAALPARRSGGKALRRIKSGAKCCRGADWTPRTHHADPPGPAVSRRTGDAGDGAAALRRRPRPADRLAARPYRSALVCATTRLSPIPRRFSCGRTITSFACSTARAFRSSASASDAGRQRRSRPTRARSGGCLRRTITSSAARRRGSGSTIASRTLFGVQRAALGRRQCRRLLRRASPKRCATPDFRPRALYERFNIEVIATTESPLDPLSPIMTRSRASGWKGRVITGLPAGPGRRSRVRGVSRKSFPLRRDHRRDTHQLARLSRGASSAPRRSSARGATSTDHGHPSARTADLAGRARRKRCSRRSSRPVRSRRGRGSVPRARCSPRWRR